jgi:hypothetical protein
MAPFSPRTARTPTIHFSLFDGHSFFDARFIPRPPVGRFVRTIEGAVRLVSVLSLSIAPIVHQAGVSSMHSTSSSHSSSGFALLVVGSQTWSSVIPHGQHVGNFPNRAVSSPRSQRSACLQVAFNSLQIRRMVALGSSLSTGVFHGMVACCCI